jgi:hypothetical protein
MVVLYPVSASVRRVYSSVEIDASTWNTGENLFCVPVRNQFHFSIKTRVTSCRLITFIHCSTYVLGKL